MRDHDRDGCGYCADEESDEGRTRVGPAALRPGADDMCPNCVTPWKCNGPHTIPDEMEGQ